MFGAKTLRWIPFWSQSLFFTIYSFHKSETDWDQKWAHLNFMVLKLGLLDVVDNVHLNYDYLGTYNDYIISDFHCLYPWKIENILQYYTVNNINFMWFFETDMLDIARSFKVIIGQISESEIHQRDLINFDIFFFWAGEEYDQAEIGERRWPTEHSCTV